MEQEKRQPDAEGVEEIEEVEEVEPKEDRSRFDRLYSNVASNRYENLRTSHIEQKAKELAKKRR